MAIMKTIASIVKEAEEAKTDKEAAKILKNNSSAALKAVIGYALDHVDVVVGQSCSEIQYSVLDFLYGRFPIYLYPLNHRIYLIGEILFDLENGIILDLP